MLQIIRSKTEAEALAIVGRIKEKQGDHVPAHTNKVADEYGKSPKESLASDSTYLNTAPYYTIGLDGNSTLQLELIVGSPVLYPPPPPLPIFSKEIRSLFRPFKVAASHPERKLYVKTIVVINPPFILPKAQRAKIHVY